MPLQLASGDAVAKFTLSAGDSVDFVLEPAMLDGASPSSAENYVSDSSKGTMNYWRRWVAR